MEENSKKPSNGMEKGALGTAMLGNFKPAELDRSARDISLGNFEPTGKKQDNSEKS